jgi:hypothetical protein
MNAKRALTAWTEANRELKEEERIKCETVLEISGLEFSGFAVDEGKRRFSNPQIFSMFLVDQHWWFDHQLCEGHSADFCQACKPQRITNYVVYSQGSSNRYHCDRDCTGLIGGQNSVHSPAPIKYVTVHEAKRLGKDACLVCKPPKDDFTEEFGD